MKASKFKESNTVFAKDQPEYNQLPAFVSPDGIATTCWSMSLMERVKFLFTNKLWISVMTFNKPLQPMLPSLDKPDWITEVVRIDTL